MQPTTTKPDVAAALNEQRSAIEAKLDALRASPSPEVAQLLRQADLAVTSFREQATALEGQLAGIDAELGVRERDRRSAAEQQRAKELASSSRGARPRRRGNTWRRREGAGAS